jgi:hypothetical protein
VTDNDDDDDDDDDSSDKPIPSPTLIPIAVSKIAVHIIITSVILKRNANICLRQRLYIDFYQHFLLKKPHLDQNAGVIM